MHDLDRTLRSQEPELESWEAEGEMELAAELLTVTNEQELDYFFGKLFKNVAKFAKPLGQVLKPIAKVALPIAGKVAGSFFGGPIGGAIGGKLGTFASNLFEFEAESYTPQELEVEVARRIVRLGNAAAQNMASAPVNGDPIAAARLAVAAAAREHAPGLLRKRSGCGCGCGVGQAPSPVGSGRWSRRGNDLEIFGV